MEHHNSLSALSFVIREQAERAQQEREATYDAFHKAVWAIARTVQYGPPETQNHKVLLQSSLIQIASVLVSMA